MKSASLSVSIVVSSFLVASIWQSTLASPVVPAHQRFQGDENYEQFAGRLLFEELSCQACHAAPDSLTHKQAPVLTQVTQRAKVEHLRKFILNPQQTKPGTSMPQVLSKVTDAEAKVDAILHYLGSLASPNPPQAYANFGGKQRGEKLFHSVGCVACHNPTDTKLSTSAPLGDLAAKYTLPALAEFLRDPLKVRHSGRMPSVNLTVRESQDIAAYLLPDTPEKAGIEYEYYELENPRRLPDFEELTPLASGAASKFDVQKHAKRRDNFGLRYHGNLQVAKAGKYRFFLGSDDGSRLIIDGQVIIDNDGEHGMQMKRGAVELSRGIHAVQIQYFERGGGEELSVSFQPPGGDRGPLDVELVASAPQEQLEDLKFAVDSKQVAQGKALFGTLGCANCHEAQGAPASSLTAAPVKQLDPKKGCLSNSPTIDYDLNDSQQAALTDFVAACEEHTNWTDAEKIQYKTLQFNCLACHQRGELGGVEEKRVSYFQTTQQEMGIEGSIPPHLNGVGDKLTLPWLKQILAEGAKDRPYMLTRMPKFGTENVGFLAALLAKTDQVSPSPEVEVDKNAKKIGHRLVGGKGFSCIKCHTFGRHKATGVQSIDMTIMTKRLRKDWFVRYVRNPQGYRKGTRMPSAWPVEGKSYLPDLLDGDCDNQIAAVWNYLEGGKTAITPFGLATGSKELVPIEEAIIYRNFIQGAGPRAIGVGSPEGLHYAFDANELRLALLWKGAFMNAARHWTGRGQGFEPPAGEFVVTTVTGQPFASLASKSATWPEAEQSEANRFLGYRLSGEYRYPEFRYKIGKLLVTDAFVPIQTDTKTLLRRTITVSGSPKSETYFRAAAGSVSQSNGTDKTFEAAEGLSIKLLDTSYLLRESAGADELLLPLDESKNSQTLQIEYTW